VCGCVLLIDYYLALLEEGVLRCFSSLVIFATGLPRDKQATSMGELLNLYFYHFSTLDSPSSLYIFPLFIKKLDCLCFPSLIIISFGLILISIGTLAAIQRNRSSMPDRQTRSDGLEREAI